MSFFAKLKDGLEGVKRRWSGGIASLFTEDPADDVFWSELEERLIAGDVGVDLSERLVADLKGEAKKKGLASKSKLKKIFVSMIADRLASVEGMGRPFEPDFECRPSLVLLMTGVNGSGKTTTAGKLAMQFLNGGSKVILAAADTFRAAAADQLQIWGERAGVRVVAQAHPRRTC